MDPAIQALTIWPSDWAALFDGFLVGLGYELAAIGCIVALGTALCAWLGRPGGPSLLSGDPPAPTAYDRVGSAGRPTARAFRSAAGALGLAVSAVDLQPPAQVVLVADGQYAVRLDGARRGRCARRRVAGRAASAHGLGSRPS